MIHFVGVGGYGMSALAEVLAGRGASVSGCDLRESSRTARLRERGVTVLLGHDPAHLRGVEQAVYSTDVPADHPERRAALAMGIPWRHRSELLAELIQAAATSVAVTGTHGKTTTSTLVAHLLEGAGFDPTAVVGGEVPAWGGGARLGRADLVVAEADESDGSFLRYTPTVAVATNLEPEHLEHYGGRFEAVVEAYGRFLAGATGEALVWAGDPRLVAAARRRAAAGGRARLYGLAAEVAAAGPQEGLAPAVIGRLRERRPESARLEVFLGNASVGLAEVPLPGLANLRNALAAVGACLAVDAPAPAVLASLADFVNAHRRMEVLRRGPDGSPRVVDDYAHHPTEIRAVLEALRPLCRGRLWAVFQPQRYRRTANLWEEFRHAFGAADRLILTAIYAPPGETPLPGVSAERLAREVSAPPWVRYAATLEEAERLVRAEGAPEDLVVTLGAGDVYRLARRLAQEDSPS